MARMNIIVNDDIESEFRKAVANHLGLKKGNLQLAIQEAMLLWIEKNNKKQ